MAEQQDHIFKHRLESLLDLIEESGFDALILTHDDEYLSYELNPDQERLKFLTGFSGSAGYAAVALKYDDDLDKGGIKVQSKSQEFTLKKAAAIFVDGRYVVQVKEQTDNKLWQSFNFAQLSPAQWLCNVLPRNSKVGIDMNCVSFHEYSAIKDELNSFDIKLMPVKKNLVDEIWEDRPAKVLSQVEIFQDEYNGCPSPKKRQNLAQELRDKDLDATVICDPESICWLLNIRGRDRKFLPVINCKMVAYSNEALEWYIDYRHINEEQKQDLLSHFGHVDIFPEDRFDDVLERLCNASCTVYVDPESVNAHVISYLYEGGANVIEGLGLCLLPKACKNHIEVAGEYKAHIKDGIAMCRFLSWLDDTIQPDKTAELDLYLRRVAGIDEAVLANRAEDFRKVESGYIEPSFAPISALGSNAAMCHYNHAELNAPRELGKDSLYLLDSGAHFIDGTTDITRTVLVGPNPSEEIKRMFTLVLKGHIDFASLIFPEGTSGMQLDAIARKPLWNCGCDYAHGTGHGVGHVLSVHEGPQIVSSKRSPVPLQVGMIISDEPGYYKEGEYGIRLENLLVVQRCTQPGLRQMLCFSPLTLVPFDTRLIMKELLLPEQIEWLNNYHQNVLSVIRNAATTLSDTEISWLTQATAAI